MEAWKADTHRKGILPAYQFWFRAAQAAPPRTYKAYFQDITIPYAISL